MIVLRRSVTALSGLALLLGLTQAPAQALTLEEAVSAAMERNEASQAGLLSIDAAHARLDAARAAFYPDVTLSGSYLLRPQEEGSPTETGLPQGRHTLAATANLSLTLFDGRVVPLYRAAVAQSEADELRAHYDRLQISFSAAEAYLLALGAEQVEAAARSRLQLAERALQVAQARQQAALTARNEVTRAELELATARRELTRASNARADARLLLSALTLTGAQEGLEPPEALLEQATQPHAEPGALLAAATARRLDLLATTRAADASRQLAEEPKWRALPSVGLVAQARGANESLYSGQHPDAYVGISGSWLVWDGGERRADRAEREALADAAQLSQQALRRQIEVELERAQLALASARAALEQATTAADAARRNAQESEQLFAQGLLTALALADASASLFEAETALARERFNLALALLDLRAAAGLDPSGKEPTR